MRKRKPTIDDVAALSGVARATVSRALNGGPNVSEKVRERVLGAVEKLDYKVNLQARFLAGGISRTITLVHVSSVDEEPNSYYNAGLELGAVRACAERGFSLGTIVLNPKSKSSRDRLIALAAEGRTDGVILTPPYSDDLDLVEELTKLQKPVVCISAGMAARDNACSVGIDDGAAGQAIAEFLIGCGHRRFGYIDGPEEHFSAAERLLGFQGALAKHGIPADAIAIARGNFTFKSGIEKAELLLNSDHDLTALVCANDDMAAGALLVAHRHGLDVPGDISITGFDDTPVSAIVWPPLTTIHQPIRQIGERAVARLVEAISSGANTLPSGFDPVPYRLVERESVGTARLEALRS